jgi:hypothetical protein
MPVATARFRLSASPDLRDPDQGRAGRGHVVFKPLLFIAHQEQDGFGILRCPVIDGTFQVSADDGSRPVSGTGLELILGQPGERNMEERPHGRAHRLDRERVGAIADQHHAGRADRIGGADDGAEIARIAHPVERDPDGCLGGIDLFGGDSICCS